MFLAFCFLIFAISCNCQNKIGEDLKGSSCLNNALKILAQVVFANAESVNLISFNKISNRFDFLTYFSKPIIRETVEKLKEVKIKRDYCIIIVESSSELDAFKTKVSSKFFNYRGHYLIVLLNIDSFEVENLFIWFWENQFLNVNIVLEDQTSSVKVLTFNPFNATKCGSTTPVLINQFKNGNFTSDLGQFFPDKTSDLQHCSVRIATSNTSAPHVSVQSFKNGSFRLFGRDISLINTLSEDLSSTLITHLLAEKARCVKTDQPLANL